MKKCFYIIMLPIFFLISACEKQEIVNEYVVPNRTIITTIPQSGWDVISPNKRYVAKINMPELTDVVNDYDGVLVYISFSDKIYEQIPQVFDGDSYSYITRPGRIEIEAQSSAGIEFNMKSS